MPLTRLAPVGARHPLPVRTGRGKTAPVRREFTKPMLRPLSPAVVKSMLSDGEELALIDVREELVYSQNHLLWARSVPLSRIELRFARLVPRKSTRIVLVDDGDGLVERAAAILMKAEYVDISWLEGGVTGWEKAGFVTFSGMHVPSKAF